MPLSSTRVQVGKRSLVGPRSIGENVNLKSEDILKLFYAIRGIGMHLQFSPVIRPIKHTMLIVFGYPEPRAFVDGNPDDFIRADCLSGYPTQRIHERA